jgi:hypothetical protein
MANGQPRVPKVAMPRMPKAPMPKAPVMPKMGAGMLRVPGVRTTMRVPKPRA